MSKEKSNDHGTGHIIQSLIVNVLIASSKGVAAFMTGSGSMLAETIHSFADCANQGLLLVGVKQSKRPADKKHPLGYGRSVYFWSFMVAMLLFSIGGMFSIYEGLHKFSHPEPVENIEWAIGILVFSLALEGYATYSNIVELNERRGNTGFVEYIRNTKDSDLIVIFGENSAAVFGLILAITALLAAYYTGDGRYDALGSLAIGVVLIAVAIFLSVEVKSLLIGESADSVINDLVEKEAEKSPEILELINCITIQQGPGEVLMCIKIKCKPDLTAIQISQMINKFENDIRSKAPEVKWIYIEPDLQEWK
ncbi:cation diffusion facilitator family transporter [Arcicella aurantiaca]|uniref:Cation diffusion facilitator family transporter n=1 Tax=Arcicella aurantiaca TaxID=591202 RepID=A0A316E6T4_9BACT|nr:cation diffusion facilitator family transporter [Arcicella aurantiaca]PWK26134.1 cation diffusion facilitator family transporter [Arcicella aurantiaca]